MVVPIFFAPLAAAAAPAAFITPATDVSDKVMCYTPDDRAKTCSGIATLRPTGDGTFEETSDVFIRGVEGVTLRFVSNVALRDGMLCGTPTAEQLRAGVLLRNGAALPEAEAQGIAATLEPVFASLTGREVCERYTVGRKVTQARAWATNDPGKVIDRRVRWVGKNAGYHIKGTEALALVQP